MKNLFQSPRTSLVALGVDRAVIFACVGALAVRAFMLWLVNPRLDMGDASSYLLAATNIIRYQTLSYDIAEPFLPSAYRPPLFPAYLSVLLALAREDARVVQCLQICVSVLNVVLTALILNRVAPSARKIGACLVALNPFDAVYSITFLSESFTSTLLLATAATLICMKGNRALVLGGLLMGFSCLARDIYIALVPFAAGLWVVIGNAIFPRSTRLKQACIVSLVAILAVLPWTFRNQLEFHKFIPISAGRLGLSLWAGTWAVTGNEGTPARGRHFPPKAYRSEAEADEIDAAVNDLVRSEAVFKRIFAERLKAEPLSVLKRWVLRIPMLWFGTRFDIFLMHERLFPHGSFQWVILKSTLFGLNAFLTLSALAGILFSLRRREPVVWLAVPLVFSALVYFPLNGFENRYSMPVYDFLLIFSALTLSLFVETAKKRVSIARGRAQPRGDVERVEGN